MILHPICSTHTPYYIYVSLVIDHHVPSFVMDIWAYPHCPNFRNTNSTTPEFTVLFVVLPKQNGSRDIVDLWACLLQCTKLDGGSEHLEQFSHILRISSSQLTKSYCSEG